MIDTLIVFICILITAVLFGGAYYLAKHVVSKEHRVNVLEDTYTAATEHIQKQEEVIMQLNQTIDMMERENRLVGEQPTRNRTWNPHDIMNVQDRHGKG